MLMLSFANKNDLLRELQEVDKKLNDVENFLTCLHAENEKPKGHKQSKSLSEEHLHDEYNNKDAAGGVPGGATRARMLALAANPPPTTLTDHLLWVVAGLGIKYAGEGGSGGKAEGRGE